MSSVETDRHLPINLTAARAPLCSQDARCRLNSGALTANNNVDGLAIEFTLEESLLESSPTSTGNAHSRKYRYKIFSLFIYL